MDQKCNINYKVRNINRLLLNRQKKIKFFDFLGLYL